jgi:quercetin dioxygenase-like cupin family protein
MAASPLLNGKGEKTMRTLFALAASLLLGACAVGIGEANHHHSHDANGGHAHALPPGSNEMLRSPIQAAPGLEVIVSDVIIPAGASVPLHWHPGEEFVYVIEGSAIHREQGLPDQVLEAGDTYVIRPEARHSPVGGPEGARAIVFRVHVAGQPERVLVE